MTHRKDEIIAALNKNLSVLEEAKERLESNVISDTEDDVAYSRKKIKELIEKSTEAIETMMSLAEQLEHPRAFEVLANMIKHTADMSQDLIKLQKTRKDITVGTGPAGQQIPQNGDITNNAIFVGSTAELQKFLAANEKRSNG